MRELSKSPPTGWQRVTLGEVANVEVGGTPSTDIQRFWGGDIPWMASGEVHQRRIRDVQGRITEIGLQSSNAKLVDPPAVAIALAGQGKTRGTVALTQIRVCTNQSVALMQGHDGKLDSVFLFHALDARYEELRASSAGGGRAGLSKTILESLSIDLPVSVEEQQAIAHILDTIDEAITTTAAHIDKLKLAKAGLLHDLLTRGIDENGALRDPIRHPEQFKDSDLGLIPTDWAIKQIREIAQVKYGINDAVDQSLSDGIPTITLPCVNKNGDLNLDQTLLAFSANSRVTDNDILQPGDLLFNWRNGSQEHLGKTAYFDNSGQYTHVGFLLRIRAIPEMCNSRYLWWRIHYMKTRGFFLSAKSQVNNTFNSEELNDMMMILPSLPEQEQIVSRLKPLQERIDNKHTRIEKLRTIKQGLMSDLLTGRVRVQVDSPEAG